MGEFGLSQPVPRTEDPKFLKGFARYVDDVTLHQNSFGYVLRSPHAHAEIKAIDTVAAAKAPGVLLILTAQDYLDEGLGQLPYNAPGVPGWNEESVFHPGRIPLAVDRVRYVGDGVAYIVADNIANAKDAAELIDVDYAPIASVVDTSHALDDGSPILWPDCGDNSAFEYEAGDKDGTDAAFAKADHIIRQKLVINRVSANAMEGRSILADYDPKADFHTIYLSAQSAFGNRRMLANRIFGEPESKFRVIVNDVGGSFGMKGAFYPEYALTVWASRKLGRPVKWVAERSESFISDNHGRDNITEAELALDAAGKFLALRVKTICNLGAYFSTMGGGPPVNHIGGLVGVYTTPVAHVHVTGVFTNTNPTAAYRGAGRPEASYVCERMVDQAARELNMDPVEIRRLNLIPAAAIPYQTPLFFKYDSGDFEQTFDMGLDLADYDGFDQRRGETESQGKLRGLGLSYTIERAAPPGMEFNEIRFDAAGKVTVFAGTTNHGQGHHTMYTQVVCEMLGLTPDDVSVIEGDTGRVQNGFGTGGSRVSAMGTAACYIAANKIIDKGKQIAAHLLEAAVADIAFENATFTIAGTDKSVSLADVAKTAYSPQLCPPGIEMGLSETGTHRSTAPNYPNGCHFCEVEVDPQTGKVDVVKYTVVDDVGTVINPMLLEGQIHGGVAQGLGQILFEDIVYDRDSGQLLSGSFMDYCMPKAGDMSDILVAANPVPTDTNPFGIKGAGEAGTIGSMPAVMNAILNALAPLGVEHLDMPATPEKIWAAIRDAAG